MFHEYPYTDFHELNLDWLMGELKKYTGLKLAVAGDKLSLVNDRGEVINSVTISYSEKALNDVDGNPIKSYIISAGTSGDYLLFTKGDGTATTIQVPYANKAKYDIDNHEIEDYVYNVQIAGNKFRITKGDGTIAELTCPYSVSATNDDAGNDIKTYACELELDGDELVLRDRVGRQLDRLTVHYAEEATHADNADDADHAIEADHADVATDATNAIESVAVDGDLIKFTTYGGTVYAITPNYAVKALKDDLGNTIKGTYFAGVALNTNTGAIEFLDAQGNVLDSIIPMAKKATNDSYNNLIADYIKTITVTDDSDYVTVTHGTGNVDTLQINYSNHAWKDTNENVIKNTYYKHCECVIDPNDHHFKIVAYNGDNPSAEIERFEVKAYMAQVDINEKDLTSYVADVDYDAYKQIKVTDGAGTTLKTLANRLNNVADVDINASLADGDFLVYDANADEWVNAELQVSLDDLTDVAIDDLTLADGDILTYDANAGEWVNSPAGSGVKDVNNCAIGAFVDTNPIGWTVADLMNGSYFRQDHALIAGDLPVLTYYDSNYSNPQSCGILDWRIHTNMNTLPYSPIAFFNEVALGTLDPLFTSATVEMWFAYPEDSSKQIKVTLAIDITNASVTSSSATIVTVGGGGAGVPTDSYAVAGTIDTNTNTYTANSTNFYNDCAYGKELVIQINGAAVQAIPIGCGLMNEDTSTNVPKRSFVDLIADIKAGVITSEVYTGYIQFAIPVNNAFALYRLAISVDASSGTIVQNTCQRQF